MDTAVDKKKPCFAHVQMNFQGKFSITSNHEKLSEAWKACTGKGDGFVFFVIPPVKGKRKCRCRHVHVQGVALVGHMAPLEMGGLFERSEHDTKVLQEVLDGKHDEYVFSLQD